MSLRFFTRIWWTAAGDDPLAQGRVSAVVGSAIQHNLVKIPGVQAVESVTTLNGEVGWEVLNEDTQAKLAAFDALLAVARLAADDDTIDNFPLEVALRALDATHPTWREWTGGPHAQ